MLIVKADNLPQERFFCQMTVVLDLGDPCTENATVGPVASEVARSFEYEQDILKSRIAQGLSKGVKAHHPAAKVSQV